MKLSYKKILEKKDYLPFYVYDYETIKGQILKLKKNLPANVKVFYSVKANPNIAILRIMKNFGLGAEIVSLGELAASQKAGFKPGEIILAGSTKTEGELLAVKREVKLITLESIFEIQRLNRLAQNLGKRPAVILRLDLQNSKKESLQGRRLVSNFGIALNEAEKILGDFSRKFPYLDLEGIHVYGSSRIYNSNILTEITDRIFSVVQDFERKFNLNFKIINLGGGFGSDIRRELNVVGFSQKLKDLIRQYHFNDRQIILELGRFLVNRAGFYLTRIIEIKKRNGINFLMVEGLLTHLNKILNDPRPQLQQFREDINNFSVEILPWRKRKLYPAVICGQMSSVADTFGRGFTCQFQLSEAKPGDFVVIRGVGAYGLTQALTFFGSRSLAAEFLLINEKLELIRDKGKPDDFLSHQRIPPVLK